MKFFALLTVLAAPLLALAQNATTSDKPLYFTLDPGFAVTAGQTANIKWQSASTVGGTVTLVLRSGPSNNLNTGLVIQKGIPNTGSFTWAVPGMITRNSDYALEIISDQDPSINNYSGFFVIESTYTVATSTGATASNSLFSSLTITAPTTSIRSTISPSTTPSTGTATSTSTTGTTSAPTTATTSTGAAFQSTMPRTNGAPRATAMAGMLGMVALGALAL